MWLMIQIVGALCLLFLFVIVIIILVVRSKLRALGKGLAGSGAKTPTRIHLVPRESLSWKRENEARKIIASLQKLGFAPLGNFNIQEIEGTQLVVLTHAAQNVYAVVYEHPVAGVWADIYSHYAEGQPLKSCTYSNMHHPGSDQVDTQPNRKSVKVPGLDIESLYARFMNERPAYELETIVPENFAMLFEKSYADEMDWRKSRGGATEDEIRRVAAATGRTVDDATVQVVRERMQQRMEDSPPAS